MKKTLLTLATLLTAAALQAQLTVYVQQPPSLEGPVEFTWNQWGAMPDMNDPTNNIVGTACFVDDGTAADSLGCNALVNGAQIAGKIAVVYRGECEFGMKAMNAQDQGAIAVVVINNQPGAPIVMGAGAVGPNVTIPAVMISQEAGEQLRDAILTCNDLELFIGSQQSFYQYNLGFYGADILVPRTGAIHSVIHTNAAEYSVDLGVNIHNYGSLTMPNARARCIITHQPSGTEVYNEVSASADIPSADSLYVTLPTFSQTNYSGSYQIVYSVEGDQADEFLSNNSLTINLTVVNDKFTYALVDPANQNILSSTHVVPANNTAGWRSCIHFRDPNASRLAAMGFYFTASRPSTAVLNDEIVEGILFEWTATITDPIQLPTGSDLTPLSFGSYTFTSDLTNTPIYVPFDEVVTLQNNTRYLLCLDSYSGNVWHGWAGSLNLDRTQAIVGEPVSMIRDGTTWYNGFTGLDGAPSAAIAAVDVNTVGIEEQDLLEAMPYPNPTANWVRVPLKDIQGAVSVRVFNTAGSQVLAQGAQVGADGILTVDMAGLSNGLYLFKLDLDNGRSTEFRVQLNK
ncbi:MAG: PA domain-containing protein [Flavobacteriales bacterium]